MSFFKNKWAIATIVLALSTIIASSLSIYYYYQYSELLKKIQGTTIHVNLGINDGKTTKWFNGTAIKSGSSLLDLTMLVANVNYTIYPGMGAFVNSINGVENSHPYYWMWWMWTSYGWMEGPIAADRYIVGDGETLFWYYEDTSISPLPTPP
ncbi:MAG: DUF4430 domain-containing protein [Nitrososphaerota archaeon]